MINSLKIVKSDLMISHSNPSTLLEYSQNDASYLIGLEKWLTEKLGFEVEIFTSEQKKWLKCRHLEISYTMADQIIVGPMTYRDIMRGAKNIPSSFEIPASLYNL